MLTYEEFSTLLIHIKYVLNSRPLCRLTEDPDDLAVLTPGHFLIGNILFVVPKSNLEETFVSRLFRWQLTRKLIDHLGKIVKGISASTTSKM